MGGNEGSRGKGRSHPRTFLFAQRCFYMPRQTLKMPRMFKLGLVEWSNRDTLSKYYKIIKMCLYIVTMVQVYRQKTLKSFLPLKTPYKSFLIHHKKVHIGKSDMLHQNFFSSKVLPKLKYNDNCFETSTAKGLGWGSSRMNIYFCLKHFIIVS